ncbi:MAG: AI-2E family transporter [Bdellovibrionales bacterium]|nr:AI-2E family transporter [Bdellovibrionales bacterium]
MATADYQQRLRAQRWIKTLTFFSVLILGGAALVVIDNLLLSIVLAVMISYLISPIVSYLEGAGLTRLISIILVYSFFTTLAGIVIWAVSPFIALQLSSLKTHLPEYVDGTVTLFNDTTRALELNSGGVIQLDISDRLRAWLTNQSSRLVEVLPSALSSSASVLFLSPLLGFFILKDGQQFSREILKLVPNNIFELTLSLQHQISQQIAYYIRARIVEAFIVGLVCLIGFLTIGYPYAVLLALFAAIANLIPYVGPLFGAAPGIIIALINHTSGLTLALVCTVYIIAQLIDNFIIIPLVVARIVNLHPLTVILVVLLGAQSMGILGMLISIPLASTIKVTFRSVYGHLTGNSL